VLGRDTGNYMERFRKEKEKAARKTVVLSEEGFRSSFKLVERSCWLCGSPDHVKSDCPQNEFQGSDQDSRYEKLWLHTAITQTRVHQGGPRYFGDRFLTSPSFSLGENGIGRRRRGSDIVLESLVDNLVAYFMVEQLHLRKVFCLYLILSGSKVNILDIQGMVLHFEQCGRWKCYLSSEGFGVAIISFMYYSRELDWTHRFSLALEGQGNEDSSVGLDATKLSTGKGLGMGASWYVQFSLYYVGYLILVLIFLFTIFLW
jgi:hypothetical protein